MQYLLTRTGRALDNIRPTESALLEHTKRAVFKAIYCLGKCLVLSTEVIATYIDTRMEKLKMKYFIRNSKFRHINHIKK